MSGLRTPTRYSMQAPSGLVKAAERNWTLKATYVEIYNEQLRDLLVPEHIPPSDRGQVSIREDTKGHILLTGLHQVEINSVDDLMGALNFGSAIRQTDSTAINAKSSRSHAVFSLNLIQRRAKTSTGAEKRFSVPLEAMTGAETWTTFDSKLHFVDLAGSERLKNTGAQGDRAKEGISINAGLASLGKVISQLSSRQAGSHVSYRDSKLTRLLQDSLGGNAITYMIACVTPAEFHLSETLNTVQYAQRARAIQSKPQIQQVSDESDKQALIDRLKAEVAFLRDQVRAGERGGDRRTLMQNERPERQHEREIVLQNQLLDQQENYTNLSQRHAKLISDMSKARDAEAFENDALEGTLGDKATERLQRSNSFAEAVEKVVLEYEKTIQSLEQSLSNTRSNLSSTEAALLEKETKSAYIETVNSQLQARLQKMMVRESSTENYLQDLEAKLSGHTSGEEKNSAIITELRKEIARVRESEASCEDYISTLEERLAEADQDSEMMQREIERLEHVVERQRSLGKLDNLLLELDHIQQDPKASTNNSNAESRPASANGNKTDPWAHSRKQSLASRRAQKDMILENDEGEYEAERAEQHTMLTPSQRSAAEGPEDYGEDIEDGPSTVHKALSRVDESEYSPQSPAQNQFINDKFENVQQELFDLKVEHESTVNEFDILQLKYEEALRTLAEMQDTLDEAKHPQNHQRDSFLSLTSPNATRPTSFLADARVSELKSSTGHFSPSRSLSSELSSAGEESITTDATEVDHRAESLGANEESHDKALAEEVEVLKRLAAEKELAQKELTDRYAQLEAQHQETLDVVEELKTSVSKAKANDAYNPRSASPVIRRKSSQNVLMVDKAHRSFASLRNIATENFEDDPDTMQNFELNLNAAMHELHSRSERVQELEADITAVKKEMETKMTLISGLTRERSSIRNSSPMDISVVSTMRDQLLQSENQVRTMQESHGIREKGLQVEIDSLKAAIEKLSSATTSAETSIGENDELIVLKDKRIADLEHELAEWEDRHSTALSTMQASEKQLLATIAEMSPQAAPSTANAEKAPGSFPEEDDEYDIIRDVDPLDDELHRQHKALIDDLHKELETHRAAVSTNAARVVELEQAHATVRSQLDDTIKSRETTLAELESHKADVQSHKDLVAKLEEQIADHEQVVKSHHEGIALLQTNHAKTIEELVASTTTSHEEQVSALNLQHENSTKALESELEEARTDLKRVAEQVASVLGVSVSVDMLEDKIADLSRDHQAVGEMQEKTSTLQGTIVDLSTLNDQILKELGIVKAELASLVQTTAAGAKLNEEQSTIVNHLAALRKEMSDLETKNKKNSRLVEELEDQLSQNFDQHQMANNRLSTLQTERNAQLDEANERSLKATTELEAMKEEYAALQVRPSSLVVTQSKTDHSKAEYQKLQPVDASGVPRSNSLLQKKPSVSSLPSPPPAIPLPPLPQSLNGAMTAPLANGLGGTQNGNRSPTPPSNRPGSKEASNFQQILSDQDARIKSIEKHLSAEKQLTSTLEEALTDLERQSNKVKADCDAWRRRAGDLETELKQVREQQLAAQKGREEEEKEQRWSMNVVEEERKRRREAELARKNLEERMNAISGKKKKKGGLNCF